MAAPSSAHGFSAGVASTIPPGAVGGLAGGIVFGAMMQMMEMLPMVAMLVGSESVAVGWLVHLAISALIGGAFGLLLGRRVRSVGQGAGLGLGYGLVWWILGPLLIMPLWLGMQVFMINSMTGRSLAGHLIFGVILGATYPVLKQRMGG